MDRDIIIYISLSIIILGIFLFLGWKLTKRIYPVVIAYVIFLLYLLFSRKITLITFEKCHAHTKGKNFFHYSFPTTHNIFNPSLIKTSNNGYICSVRCSTLTQKNLFYHLYGKMYYESFILFIEIDNAGNSKIIYPIHKNLKGSLEDPRMIEYHDKYILSCSEYINNKDNFPVLMIYDKNYNFVKRVDYNRNDYGDKRTVQKNWCPFVHKGELYLHTDTYPEWKIFKLDIETGNMKKIININVSSFFSIPEKWLLRCSTSWKIYNDKYYICGLHTKTKGKIPTIRSVLVLIDKETLQPTYRTEMLCLEKENHNRIQYLSGLETTDFDVILAYGLNDAEIVLKKIPKYRLKFIPCSS